MVESLGGRVLQTIVLVLISPSEKEHFSGIPVSLALAATRDIVKFVNILMNWVFFLMSSFGLLFG